MEPDHGTKTAPPDILVVEDSPTQAMQVQLFLEDSGFHVSVAGSGEEALVYLDQCKPRLVLSAVVMPKMDGFELCRRINKVMDDLPVVLLSQLSDPGEIKKGLESGAHAFIVKPYREEALLAQISSALAESSRKIGETNEIHILLVEDSATQAEHLETLLLQQGFNVTLAGNGNEALALMHKEKPSFVISDIIMPEMDGYELCRKIRASAELSHIPVLILTSLLDSEDVLRGIASGVDYYLTKPLEIEYLVETIDKIRGGITERKDEDDFGHLDLVIDRKSYNVSISDRRLLNLLLSTYENAVRQNKKLRAIQIELEGTNNRLADEVESRWKIETELRTQQKDLQASEERFRTVVQTVPDIVYRIDGRGKFVFLNDAISSIGYEVEELIGKGFSVILAPECVERVSREMVLPRYIGKTTGKEDAPKLFDERRTGERRTRGLEVELKLKQGGKVTPASVTMNVNNMVPVEVSSSGLIDIDVDKDHICIGTVGVIRDISERKRAEKEIMAHRDRLEETVRERTKELVETNTHLQQEIGERLRAEETLRHYQHIVANTTDMVALLDTSFTFLATNGAYLEAFGLAASDINGRTVAEVFGEEFFRTTIKPYADRCLAGEEVHYQNWLDFPADGRCYMDTAYFPYSSDREKISGFIVNARDITDRKKAETEREELRAQVIQSQKLESIGTLAGGVAHEINNPVNGILNYAQLIRDNLDAGSKHYEFASEIIVETERVADIVRNLLTFARQDKQTHSPARMTDIVKGATTLIQTIIRGDMIELEADVPDDLPELKCRSQQIQQVIMNLLTNARDALNERYKEYDENKIIRIHACTIEREGHSWIRTTVEDHGAGIPEKIRERIFDPFYTTKDRSKGTGLGLSISHGIVVDHHGELTVESVPNEYTRFQLDLPVDNGWELDEQK
jgi:PAS domain S-box-containing protein